MATTRQPLITFLQQLSTDNTLFEKPAWCFQSSLYPLLFFTAFFKRLEYLYKKKYHARAPDQEFSQLCAQLNTTFLGEQSFFWFKDISEHEDLYTFLCSYQGPHHVIFFINDQVAIDRSGMVKIIEIPAQLSRDEYQQLYEWLYDQPAQRMVLDYLFEQQATISLETACLLMHYQPVIGRHVKEFVDQIASALIVPEKSLFSLSQHFLGKQKPEFFKLWDAVQNDYPEEFWIAYWSEQLWQGFVFVQAVPKQGPLEAKKLVSRLPFAFMQKDWKLYQSNRELMHAHNFLYELDFNNKNGAGSYGLELFYYKFLHGQFKK